MRDDGLFVLIAIVIGVPLLLLLAFSRWVADGLGAELWVTFHAVLKSGVALVACLAAAYWVKDFIGSVAIKLLAILWAMVAWSFWSPVLDSMAIGGKDPSAIEQLDLGASTGPWWDGPTLFWSVEGLLIALMAFVLFQSSASARRGY